MSASNVTNIEALETLHRGLLEFTEEVRNTLEELKSFTHKTDEAFSHQYPAYWRQQIISAEQKLNEAKDQLAAKTGAARPEDPPPATEERKRVRIAEQRLHLCQEKLQRTREWSLKISTECDQLLGPLSDVLDHCDSLLPQASGELRNLISQLRAYAEQNDIK